MQNNLISFRTIIPIYFEIFKELHSQLSPTLRIILKKILSNIETANLLLEEGFINETMIILRSAIESIVLFCYLIHFPNKEEEYVCDSELLGFKNHFIVYKEFKQCQDNPIFADVLAKFSFEKLEEENKKIFNHLHPRNKLKLLTAISSSGYELSDRTCKRLDKFFKFRPFFMDLEKMYRELMDFSHLGLELRDILFSYYNTNSQIAHGRYHDWITINKDGVSHIYPIISQFTRIISLPILVSKEKNLIINENNQIKLKEQIEIIYNIFDDLKVT